MGRMLVYNLNVLGQDNVLIYRRKRVKTSRLRLLDQVKKSRYCLDLKNEHKNELVLLGHILVYDL